MRELAMAYENMYTARFTSGAAATLVLYDLILVFRQELQTIYRSQWTMAKFLYVFIRVITPPGVVLGTMQRVDFREPLSRQRCQVATYFLTYAMLVSIFASYGLFTLRLIALYKSKRAMVWFIATFYALTYAATLGLVIGSSVELSRFEGFYSDALKSCISLGQTNLLPPIWYAPLAYEVFVFSLTAYRAYYDAKLISANNTPFLVLFYRDGMIAFVVMTGVRVWNIWVYLTQPLSSLFVGTMLMWAVNTVLTTRVYMNLVWLVRRPAQVTGVSTSASLGFMTKSGGTSGGTTSIEMNPSILPRPPPLPQVPTSSNDPETGGWKEMKVRAYPGPTASHSPEPIESGKRPIDLAKCATSYKAEPYETKEVDSNALESGRRGRFQSIDSSVDSWRRVLWRLDTLPGSNDHADRSATRPASSDLL